MCGYCKEIIDEPGLGFTTLIPLLIDFGVLGHEWIYLSMEKNRESNQSLLEIQVVDYTRSDGCSCKSIPIRYCPFCGEKLPEGEDKE